MKQSLVIFLSLLIMTQLWSNQVFSKSTSSKNLSSSTIPLIGEKCPSFSAESTQGVLNFPNDFGNSWKIILSHPQDFTPVCTSEILELANLQNEFKKLGVELVVVSVDPVDSHEPWKKSIEGMSYKDRKPAKISFPLVADENLAISRKYGMLHPSSNSTKSVRGVFIIDPENIVQMVSFYPMDIGRSMDEILRTVSALQTVAGDNVMTPSDWRPGDDVLIPSLPREYVENPSLVPDDVYNLAWYMWFKKISE
ncbi:MAG: redoxin domain-containing protein [Prolixibacteraceae bacterium]|nr:redoxin domain-containing protein [Prolixibacteraceae bacterium]